MINPHAYHVVPKGTYSGMTKLYAAYAREVLKRKGIDPYLGKENLHWARNWHHTKDYVKRVAKDMNEMVKNGASREEIEKKLAEIAEKFNDGRYPPGKYL
jgi:hypothetical protein